MHVWNGHFSCRFLFLTYSASHGDCGTAIVMHVYVFTGQTDVIRKYFFIILHNVQYITIAFSSVPELNKDKYHRL